MPGGFRRWAMILLPLVVAARAVLLVFQLGSEHETRNHAGDPPAWPPEPGEVLRFKDGDAGLLAWAADPARRPLVAALAEKDWTRQPPDTACLLDPGAMGRNGGRLTLRTHTAEGTWQAEWNGHRTTWTRDEVDIPEPNPAVRAAEAAMLDGADCGNTARLELSDAGVEALVDALSGRQPARKLLPPRAGLNIRAVLPEALR